MSVCRLIAADIPLPEWRPSQEYPLEINIDEGTIYDGGADDNFFLHHFPYAEDYTGRAYGVSLEWNYTEGDIGAVRLYSLMTFFDLDTC